MALTALKKEVELIKLALKNTDKYGGGAGNPVRKYLESAFAEIDTSVGQLKQELKEIKRIASPGGKAESSMNAIDDSDLMEFAQQYIFILAGILVKNSNPNKIEWISAGLEKGGLQGQVRYDVSGGDQNVYNWVKKCFDQTFAIMDSDKDNPIATKIIEASNQETYDESKGKMVKPKQNKLFDAGHIESVLDAKVALTQSSVFQSENLDKAFGPQGQKLVTKAIKASAEAAKMPIDITREHSINASTGKLTGSTSVKLRPESWTENQAKGAKTSGLGSWITRNKTGMLDSIIAELDKFMQENYSDADDYMEREASPNLRDLSRALVLKNPTIKKARRNKNITVTTKFSSPIPDIKGTGSSTTYSDNVNMGTAKRAVISGKFVTKLGIKKPKMKKDTDEGGTSNLQKSAFDTRAFINSRLTKQVQSNMGRPALENKTGRLAESALVTNAVPKGGQLHMDYTYQQAPYAVFENGNQFSPNFDPRVLIEKSIRELAAQRVETKFTLRRV